MKTTPVSKLFFAGRTVSYSLHNNMDGIKKLDGYYPDSTIEKTLGISHQVPKEKVYFADPLEFVDNDIKYNVDYVVYDNEPRYPEIEEVCNNYLGKNRTNYRQKFENIRDYYYRREMRSRANTDESKYQQWQAAECIRLYDKAGDLRYRKETAEDEIKNMSRETNNIKAGITNTRKELEAQKCLRKSLEMHISHLKTLNEQKEISQKQKARMVANENVIYSVVDTRISDIKHRGFQKEMLEKSAYYNEGIEAYPFDTTKYGKYADTVRVYDSVKQLMEGGYCISASKGIYSGKKLSLSETITGFEKIIEESSSVIDEMSKYISELISKSSATEDKIKLKESFIESCKEKLLPLFEELKGYYLKQGIKIIK